MPKVLCSLKPNSQLWHCFSDVAPYNPPTCRMSSSRDQHVASLKYPQQSACPTTNGNFSFLIGKRLPMSFPLNKKLNPGRGGGGMWYAWYKVVYWGLGQLWLASSWPFPLATPVQRSRKFNASKVPFCLSQAGTAVLSRKEDTAINNEIPKQKYHFMLLNGLAAEESWLI